MSEKIHRQEFRGFVEGNGTVDILLFVHVLTDALLSGPKEGVIERDGQVWAKWKIERKPAADPVQESELGGLFAAAALAGAHPLRHEHRYNEYVASLRGTPAIPFGTWIAITPIGETDCHRSFDDYREARGAEGLAALTMEQFAPVWLECRRGLFTGESIQQALRCAEAEAGLSAQAAS